MEINASMPYAGDYDDEEHVLDSCPAIDDSCISCYDGDDRIEVTTFGDCLIKVNDDVLEFDTIGELFLSNFDDFGKKICISIEAIHKMNWSNSGAMLAQLQCSDVYRMVLLENCDHYVDGVPSCMKSAWYCASKEEIQRIVSHGFGHHQLGNIHGICFTPLNRLAQSLRNCVVDDDGFKHVLLCRVLIEDGDSMTKLESEVIDDEDSPSVYFVRDTKMNTHILPEYVVTFRTVQCLEELSDADEEQGFEDDYDVVEDGADDSMHIFTGHIDELYTVACSPTDPTLVATGGGDDKGFMWRIGEGDWAFEIQGHKDSVSSVSFSADGQLLASGSFDGSIHVWDVSSGKLKCTLDGPGGGIEWVKWHPKGHLVLAGSEDCSVWMWNADKGLYLNMFSGHGNVVTCGDFTPNGKIICTGSDDATLRIWNPKSGENIHEIKGHPFHTDGLTCMAISPDSTIILTGSKDLKAHLVKISSGKVVGSLIAHTDSVECVGFSPSGPWAATGSLDQKLIVWDLQHLEPRNIFRHEYGVTCLIWLGKSRFIATGSVDGKVQVWDSLSGGETVVRSFSGHTEPIQSLSVSADGDFLVSVSLDGTARVFEIDEFK